MKNFLPFTSLDIYEVGFTAESAGIDVWRKTTGARIGLFDPSSMVEDYLGLVPRIEDAALYCLRRFGNPTLPIDSYKEVAKWVITTPHPDVWLSITLGGGGLFGYLLTPELDQEAALEQTAPQREWGAGFRKWAKKEKGVILYNPFTWYGECSQDEADAAFNVWGRKEYPELGWDEFENMDDLLNSLDLPEGYDPEAEERKIYEAFADYKKAEAERLLKEYNAPHPKQNAFTHPFEEWSEVERRLALSSRWLHKHRMRWLDAPVNALRQRITKKRKSALYATPFWRDLPEDSLTWQINEALFRALQDLMRPCAVRDWEVYFYNTPALEQVQGRKWDADDELLYDYFVSSN